jgi:uncharacterized protein YeaO (DUF488 family)
VGWKIALYFAVVFAAGIGVGILAQRFVIPVPVRAHDHPPKGADRFRKEMVEELTKRLSLDPGQVIQLQAVLDGSRKEFQDFRARHKDEMDAIYHRQHEQISAILRPDQRVAYEKLQAERERHEHDEDAAKKGHHDH